MAFDLDVFIPTLKQRTPNLLCQVYTALNSGLNVRVTISLPDGHYPEVAQKLTYDQLRNIRFVTDVPQGEPSIPIKYCLEHLDWSDWMISVGDDDCILPWGLKHLFENTQGVSMVIGQTIGVSKEKHHDFSHWKIGYSVTACHVSTALINMKSLMTLPKPWLEIHPLSDFYLIKRMSEHFPYKIIPNVVHVQSFAEARDLGEQFEASFKQLYGHML